MKRFLMIAALAALTGCHSLKVMQSNHFADADGNVVKVEFCKSPKGHTVRYPGPKGDELTSETRLAVKVVLPNDKGFTAWKTLNPPQLATGTAYKTDDGKFMFWAHGFDCIVFIYDEKVNDYAFIFEGTLIKN